MPHAMARAVHPRTNIISLPLRSCFALDTVPNLAAGLQKLLFRHAVVAHGARHGADQREGADRDAVDGRDILVAALVERLGDHVVQLGHQLVVYLLGAHVASLIWMARSSTCISCCSSVSRSRCAVVSSTCCRKRSSPGRSMVFAQRCASISSRSLSTLSWPP